MRIIYEQSKAADGQDTVREVKISRNDTREISRKWFGTRLEMDALAAQLRELGKVVIS